jgi:uncharacterized linocin/CFP29 family protein
MTAHDPQLPWTDEQWARVNQVIHEEASRARIAATFLPMVGPLHGGTDFVRRELIRYRVAPPAQQPPPLQIAIDDRNIWQLATLKVTVRVRGAQMSDPEMTSAMSLFRRAANVLARLEDAVVFNGLLQPGGPGTPLQPTGGAPPQVWEITGGEPIRGLLDGANFPVVVGNPPPSKGERLVRAVSLAIGNLEANGQFGPFAVVLGQGLFVVAETPEPNSMVLPQDRIIPFLGGGSFLRSTTLPVGNGVVVALGGAPVELVFASDLHLHFLQQTADAEYLFRVSEKMALRIKEPPAIITLQW